MNKSASPVITVLMADYNTDLELLKIAIQSIIDQTEPRFEILIVDDGTTNDLAQLTAEFKDDRIRVVGYGENRGFVAALNFGIKHARAEFIARMDTDDRVEPTYLAETYAFLNNRPEFAAVSGQAIEIAGDGEPGLLLGSPGELTPKKLMRGSAMIHPATMLRKSAVVGVGGYPDYRRAEDLALWCELLLAGERLFVLDRLLLWHRVSGDDFNKRTLRNRKDEIRVRFHYYPKLGAGPREYLRILKSILSGALPIPLVRWLRRRIHQSA